MNIKLINLLIAAALTLAGFAYSEEAQANTATVSPALDSDELPTKYELYEQFLDSNGGRSNLSDMVSVIIHGTIKQNDTELDFKIFRKRPNKLRIQINRNGFQINTIYDGHKAWIELVNQSDEIDIIELDEDEQFKIAKDSKFDSPFFIDPFDLRHVTVVGYDNIGGREAIRLDFDPKMNFEYKSIWLSLDHYQEIKLLKILPSKEDPETGETIELYEEIIVEDFFKTGDVYWAKKMRHSVDGEPFKEIYIKDVQANIGVFNYLFKRSSNAK